MSPDSTESGTGTNAADERPADTAARRDGAASAALRLLWRHRMMTVAVLAGAAVRLTAVLGFRPALWFNDSYEYIAVAVRPQPYPIRPAGYSAFLRLLLPLHSFTAVVIVQHLLGLGVAVALYALLRRWRTPAWLATLAAMPQLFSAREVELEHLIMADTLFTAMLFAALVVLAWSARPNLWQAVAAGLLLSGAALVRSVGLPLLVLAGCYLLVRRVGWRAVVAFGLVGVVPLGGYAVWFHSAHGNYALSNSDGVFLYSRTMSFADCARIRPPAELTVLCDSRPPAGRPAPSDYIWHSGPLDLLPGQPALAPGQTQLVPPQRFAAARNDPARRFALLAIRRQPVDYARVVVRDLARSFAWTPPVFPNTQVYRGYLFSTAPVMQPSGFVYVQGGSAISDTLEYARSPARTRIVSPYAGFLIDYQRGARLPGPLLGVLLAAGLAGLLAARRRDPRRWPVLLLWSMAAAVLILPPLTAQFDNRYVLPAIVPTCAAAALSVQVRCRPC